MYPRGEMKVIEDEVENFVAGKFDPVQQEYPIMGTIGEEEIWRCLEQHGNNLLDIDVDEALLLFNNFPDLEDIQCMSSSLATSSSANSSAATMDDAFSQTVGVHDIDLDCMQVMENFGLDTTGIWDPSLVFGEQIENNPQIFQPPQQRPIYYQEPQMKHVSEENNDPVGELRKMLFEWLQNNKDSISAEEVRNIKLNRNTIESAWKRLGNTSEGRKHLLQLVLQWVQENHLNKKAPTTQFSSFPPIQNPNFQIPNPIYSPNPNFDSNACLPHVSSPPPPFYNNINSSGQFMVPISYNPYMENPNLQTGGICGNQYVFSVNGDCERLRQSNSATREARKNRMARQKRILAQNRNVNQIQNPVENQNRGFVNGGENNWAISSNRRVSACVYPSTDVSMINQMNSQSVPVMPVMEPGHPVSVDQSPAVMHAPRINRQVQSEERPGLKPEKRLKLLLQKVLKQSDVANLGRIVLPKKEAETQLPPLEARDGIVIAMEDIGTCRVWNLRYRFWPNNKSRMYILENTGDFVRANGLQEEDFIVLYLDKKSGKYLIRGVKVRLPWQRLVSKKPTRRSGRGSAKSGNKERV